MYNIFMGHERGEKMSPRTGRPIVGARKDVSLKICFDQETNEKLLEYCQKNNVTKSEAIRRALKSFLFDEKK